MNVLVDLEKRKTIIKSLIWQVAFRRLEERTMFKAKEIDEISDWFWDEDEDEVPPVGKDDHSKASFAESNREKIGLLKSLAQKVQESEDVAQLTGDDVYRIHRSLFKYGILANISSESEELSNESNDCMAIYHAAQFMKAKYDDDEMLDNRMEQHFWERESKRADRLMDYLYIYISEDYPIACAIKELIEEQCLSLSEESA